MSTHNNNFAEGVKAAFRSQGYEVIGQSNNPANGQVSVEAVDGNGASIIVNVSKEEMLMNTSRAQFIDFVTAKVNAALKAVA